MGCWQRRLIALTAVIGQSFLSLAVLSAAPLRPESCCARPFRYNGGYVCSSLSKLQTFCRSAVFPLLLGPTTRRMALGSLPRYLVNTLHSLSRSKKPSSCNGQGCSLTRCLWLVACMGRKGRHRRHSSLFSARLVTLLPLIGDLLLCCLHTPACCVRVRLLAHKQSCA